MTDPHDAIANADAVYLDASAIIKAELEEDPGSRVVRILVYASHVPVFASVVAFGEFISKIGQKLTQQIIGPSGYLYRCRAVLVDFQQEKIHPIEPSADRFRFIELSGELLSHHPSIGGGDLWHLMAALELQRTHPATVLLCFDKGLVAAARSEQITAVYGYDLVPDTLEAALRARDRLVSM